MIKTKFWAIIMLAALVFASCDDTTETIGNSLTNQIDLVDVFDTTIVVKHTCSVVHDSVLALSQYGYLGRVKDSETNSYVTCNYTTQFHVMPDMFDSYFSSKALAEENLSVVFNSDGTPAIDSCYANIYCLSYIGDSLNPMQLELHELETPVYEKLNYYSDFDPEEEQLLRNDDSALVVRKTYTPLDLTLSAKERSKIIDGTNLSYIRIPLNKPYYKKNADGSYRKYNNIGHYFYESYKANPHYFTNNYEFNQYVLPGFYIKTTDGTGVMSKVYTTELLFHIKYAKTVGDSLVGHQNQIVTLSGTEEVMITNTIKNDTAQIHRLVAEDTLCTYLKTPAGVFTEVTLPVEEVMHNHTRDSLSLVEISFQKYNQRDEASRISAPTSVLMLPVDSMIPFFEKKSIENNLNSFIATLDSKNCYTFNNIAPLIVQMYHNRSFSPNWNKVLLIPVTRKTSSSTSTTTASISNEMGLSSCRLVKAGDPNHDPVKLYVIYNRFRKD